MKRPPLLTDEEWALLLDAIQTYYLWVDSYDREADKALQLKEKLIAGVVEESET